MLRRVKKAAAALRRLATEDGAPPLPPATPSASIVPLDSIHAARFLFFDHLITRTADVAGDIVECGVGSGTSMLLMAHSVHARQLPKNLWGFDSFEGFPEPTQEDASQRQAKKGEWALAKQQALTLLQTHLNDELFFRSKLSLIAGFFEDSLQVHNGAISLLHLDCDLYLSYKTCLETLYPKVSPGGIIAFDEYHREGHVWPGAPKAIDEFFANKEVEFVKDSFYGKFYAVKPV